jgi:hypothetical protein
METLTAALDTAADIPNLSLLFVDVFGPGRKRS